MIINTLTRRVIFTLIAILGAFILWLVPSFIVMAPDSNYAERMTREAELVAVAIARGGLTSRAANRIGGNPADPRTIAAQQRSPFRLNRTEGIIRHMQAITNKRIVLYDHQRRIVMDSDRFIRRPQITTHDLPPLKDLFDENRPFPKNRREINAQRNNFKKNIGQFDFSPPRGNGSFVRAALAGKTLTRRKLFSPSQDRFSQSHSVLQAAAPIRRLKFIHGAVVLMDMSGADRRAWRWRALFDSAPVFAAFIVALILLLLWMQKALIRPLARLAYGASDAPALPAHPAHTEHDAPPRRTKRSDEIDMIARRHQAGQVAAQNFAEASRALSSFQRADAGDDENNLHVADSKMAAQIHAALIGAKMDEVDISLIVQQCIHRHNMRARKSVWDKMRIQPAAPDQIGALPFGDPVMLEKVETGQTRNAFTLPVFSHALTLALDYLIQGCAAPIAESWPQSVRVALIRQKRAIRILIEDDGPDIAAPQIKAWAARAYDLAQPPLYTLRAIQTCLAMHNGRVFVDSLRPARIIITLPLPHESP